MSKLVKTATIISAVEYMKFDTKLYIAIYSVK